jgi:MarR family transcriptional regulator, transcriptional regulator for hemolysin
LPEPLNGNLCWLLNRAGGELAARLGESLSEVGLTTRMHMVLVAARERPHTQIELAREVGLDKTTLVAALDDLEAAGLAERRPSSSDRRARVIAVTGAGEERAAAADAIMDRIRDDFLAELPDAERDAFLATLRGLVVSLHVK